jgi:hypothetical protein
MSWGGEELARMEQERREKQDALPDMLLDVVNKLDEISDSLNHTLEKFKPVETTKVFLSHKSIDKPIVSRYTSAFKICGFQPWIDDDEMPAGSHLDAALINGMKESCAAVFFITPNFTDERFLKQEIEYAVNEERDRPDDFVIIPLLIGGASQGNVPTLLSRFVAKTAVDELGGLMEIIKALPIKPGPPVARTLL